MIRHTGGGLGTKTTDRRGSLAMNEHWRMVHLFEKDVLCRCAEEAGFTVQSLAYLCFRKFPTDYRTDRPEFLTLTARKPA